MYKENIGIVLKLLKFSIIFLGDLFKGLLDYLEIPNPSNSKALLLPL